MEKREERLSEAGGNYRVGHTVDQLGGRYPSAIYDRESYARLEDAEKMACEYTIRGQCGFVERIEDGAVLAPDGNWITEDPLTIDEEVI